jgi:hypothetical protein
VCVCVCVCVWVCVMQRHSLLVSGNGLMHANERCSYAVSVCVCVCVCVHLSGWGHWKGGSGGGWSLRGVYPKKNWNIY